MAPSVSSHPRALSDGYRGWRALLIGSATTLLLLGKLPLNESVSIGFLAAMVIDLLAILRVFNSMTGVETRRIFSGWRANRTLMMKRIVLLTFVSIGLLSLSVNDVHKVSMLPPSVRIFIYFVAMFTTWMQLHLGFAIFYAKTYYLLNPNPAADGPNPQGFVFAGTDEPVITDFLYVAFAVGLTYAMSDVNLEDHRIRRVVLFHSIVSFLFYSTVISSMLNLMTSG